MKITVLKKNITPTIFYLTLPQARISTFYFHLLILNSKFLFQQEVKKEEPKKAEAKKEESSEESSEEESSEEESSEEEEKKPAAKTEAKKVSIMQNLTCTLPLPYDVDGIE
jgi:cytoskeletal protein RodZ